MALFAIHSVAAASMYDMPAVAESTWHGSCLACAEMARRGMVSSGNLPKLIGWMEKVRLCDEFGSWLTESMCSCPSAQALYFDIRKGAHSIGANVRDAAGYVLWALARAQDATALAPHANNLAQRLVTVALYDREIHIRRAASAAFQEHVGRMVTCFLLAAFHHGTHHLASRISCLMASTFCARLTSTQ
jgi:tubulin-specific chaperone D